MSFRTRIVKVAAVVTLSGAVLGIGSSAAMAAGGDPSQWGKAGLVGDPSQWGTSSMTGDPSQAAELTRKVNEYEGQHRLTVDDDQSLTRKVNEYEGQHRLAVDDDQSLTRKVNEYEGQHR